MSTTAAFPAVDERIRSGGRDGPVTAWLGICAAMVFLIVVIGGITRLTESGLSITEWKPVSGILPPLNEAQWTAEFEKYQRTPEYQELSGGMTLRAFKTIFFWEYLHRVWARLVGAVFALPFLFFLLRGRIDRRWRGRLAGILVLIGLQGALGWYMVQSGLAERTDVSQYRLTAHLSLALLIYVLLVWTALAIRGDDVAGEDASRATRENGRALKGRLIAALALVSLTIVSGGFVAGLNAGKAFNTFPLMAGRVVPDGYAGLQPWYMNLFENVAAVQFNHRVLAITTFLFAMYLVLWGMRRELPARGRRGLAAIGGVALLQVALGIATLVSNVGIPLAAAHQAGAVLLLTAVVVSLSHAAEEDRREKKRVSRG